MWLWTGAIVSLVFSAIWIVAGSVDVFRGKIGILSPKLLPLWGFHAGSGFLGLWLLLRATGTQ